MKKPALLVSLNTAQRPNEREKNPVLLRNTLLQSETTLQIDKWTKGNLLRSITRLGNRMPVAYVFSTSGGSEGPRISLGTREVCLLSEALEADALRNSPFSLFILYCDSEAFGSVERLVAASSVPDRLFILCNDTDSYFFFALACELTHWWNIRSLLFEDVSFEHIARCIQVVAEAYLDTGISSGCRTVLISKPRTDHSIAWAGGLNYVASMDPRASRQEGQRVRFEESLEKIFEAARHPREQHRSSSERLISSQALFWLAEILPADRLAIALRDTRLFQDCHPYAASASPAIRFRAADRPGAGFLESILNSFVPIPGGIYPFGSDDVSIESEPTAEPTHLEIPPFSIMKSLVTYRFLQQFMVCETAPAMEDDPVTEVSFFDAEHIAAMCTEALRRCGSRFHTCVVRIPTEYQWEASGRGFKGNNYPWGDGFEPRHLNSGMRVGHPTEPGLYSPGGDSVYGCQDMSGNVKEWTRSYAGTRGIDWTVHSQQRVSGDKVRIVESSRMVVRGGSYSYPPECLLLWVRNSQIAGRRDPQTGFRLVLEDTSAY